MSPELQSLLHVWSTILGAGSSTAPENCSRFWAFIAFWDSGLWPSSYLSSCTEQGGGGDEVLKQSEDRDSEEPGGWCRWSTPFFSITVITALVSHLPEFPDPCSPGPALSKLLDRVLVLVHWEAEKFQTDSPLIHPHRPQEALEQHSEP